MKQVQVEVLKRFAVSDDGVTVRQAKPGPDSINADLFAGLKADGFVLAAGEVIVEPAAPTETSSISELPEDWREMHHNALIKIAKTIDDTVSTKADAIAAIELSLEQAKQG